MKEMKRILLSVVLFVISSFIFIAWNDGHIRFEYVFLNYFSVVLACIFPVISLTLVFRCSIKWIKIIGISIYSLSSLITLPLLFIILLFTYDNYQNYLGNKDYSFEKISTHKIGQNHISVFRTSGGATTSFGIVIRQENTILPGLLYTKRLYSRYKAYTAIISKVDQDKIKCIIPEYNEVNADTVFITLN